MADRWVRSAFFTVAVLLVGGSGAVRAQDAIFVANRGNLEGQGQSITVYARTADGNVAPIRTISGAATRLGTPMGVVVDRERAEIVVVDDRSAVDPRYGAILVYGLSANGNVAPLRTQEGSLPQVAGPWGLALDDIHGELVVANEGAFASLTIHARAATGNTAPLRMISGSATGLSRPAGPAVDATNDEIVVANYSNNSITVYARTAGGNAAPLRTISGPGTGLNGPIGVTLDLVHDELIVANFGGSSINVYARTANGNAAPLRTMPGLNSPAAVALDTVHDEIAVASFFNPGSVNVYPRGGGSSLRWITGSSTGLYAPVAVAIFAGAGSGFYPVRPCRVLDTRMAPPALAGLNTRPVTVVGTCGVPPTAKAVAMTVVAVNPSDAGFLTIYPGGTAQPITSAVNFIAGRNRANNGIFVLGSNGGIVAYDDQPAGGTVQLVLDVTGYFQ